MFGIGLLPNFFLNLTNISILRLFKMITNQTECSRLEQRSVIKCSVAEKCKPCEIYKRMCDVYGEVCFSKIIFYNWAKHECATRSLSKKKQFMELKHTSGTAVSKEDGLV